MLNKNIFEFITPFHATEVVIENLKDDLDLSKASQPKSQQTWICMIKKLLDEDIIAKTSGRDVVYAEE